jgi:tetratricopeptide (TPR) repeat protein
MSQTQLAKPTYSDSYISLIEAGKRTPSSRVIQELAERLGCSADYLNYGIGTDALADLRTQLRSAHAALGRGEVTKALTAFNDLLGVPHVTLLAGFYRQARVGHALALEAAGHLHDAIVELQDVADAVVGHDWAEWAALQIALLRCRRKNGQMAAGVAAAEAALARLSCAEVDFTDSAIHFGVTLIDAYLDRGDLLLARQLMGQLVRVAEASGSPRAQMDIYRQAASVADAHGDHQHAVELAERALEILTQDEQVRALGRLRIAYAGLLLKARPEQADRAHALLLQQREELGETAADRPACLVELARAQMHLGSPDTAVARAMQAIEMLGDTPSRALADAYAVLGEAHSRRGEHQEAIAALTRSAEYLDDAQFPRQAAQVWVRVAELLHQSGSDTERQASTYRRALTSVGLAPNSV